MKDGIVSEWTGRSALALIAALLLVAAPALAGGNPNNNTCEADEEPDVVLGSIHQTTSYTAQGGVSAFTIGTWSCNLGDCELQWISSNNNHPVIGQNMFRLRDDRFEQIGMGWLKHGFFALSNTLCESGCIGTNGSTLGVNCADPYTSNRNGQQSNLGPRFEVNASTGVYSYPFSSPGGSTGNSIFKRIQVNNSDLSPALNAGAQYYVEGMYVTKDDAAAENQDNNYSYRRANVNGTSSFSLSLTGPTFIGDPAIFAWAAADPSVTLTLVDVGPDDGIFWVGAKAVDEGGGNYRYEYAVQNLNSDRAARGLRIPGILPGTNPLLSFKDIDYHSGEPYTNADWSRTVEVDGLEAEAVFRSQQTFDQNPNANALRWGTLYNFTITTDQPPTTGSATLELFKPGTPSEISFDTVVPQTCNFNAVCDTGETVNCGCTNDCPPAAAEFSCSDTIDDDCDGQVDCFDVDCCTEGGGVCGGVNQDFDELAICDDCDDMNDTIWTGPSVVTGVFWMENNVGTDLLNWSAPTSPGASTVHYETFRSTDFTDFLGAQCLVGANPASRRLEEPTVPGSDSAFYYLIRSTNNCPGNGAGSVGTDSSGVPRAVGACK